MEGTPTWKLERKYSRSVVRGMAFDPQMEDPPLIGRCFSLYDLLRHV